MSFLLRTSTSRLALATRTSTSTPLRAFSLTATRSLKESDRHDPAQAANNEKHKQDSIAKSKEGKGHWKPELASDSEEAVAADRHEHADHSEGGLKDLQDKTKGHAEQKHKSGTSQEPGL